MTKHTKNLSFFKPNRRYAGKKSTLFAINLIVITPLITPAFAQTTAPESILKPIVVTAPAAKQQLGVGGFADVPLRETPISATVITAQDIQAVGAQRLADLYKLDASVSDAYNAVGYIDYAIVRGYLIDNKFNIRRDGLPISGDTAIGLANKDRLEILKGISGIQAGTSAPGGLVNYVVKRPAQKPIRNLDLHLNSHGQFGAALDLGGRFGEGGAQGYRFNVAADRLSSAAPQTRGSRQMLALALDSRVSKDGFLEAEFEWSQQRQPNVSGLSILGNAAVLPSANPQLNLNRQAWSLPTEFEGLTGSLRYSHALSDTWQWTAHVASQRLRTNDRIAFPFGCTDSNGIDYYADRFCPNGDADLYDFRSEGEKRHKLAAQFKLEGSLQVGAVRHALSMGILQASSRVQMPDSAYNFAGTVNLSAPTQPVPADPSLTMAGNIQREKTLELFASDVISWSPAFKTWLGLRHTRLQRSDALNAQQYNQSFTTPWLALSYAMGAHTLFASYGQGIESRVTPNLPAYGAQAGLPLAAQRSRQTELGIKSQWQISGNAKTDSSLSVFDIRQPLAADTGSSLVFDGEQRHQGLELQASHAQGAWQLSASGSWLNARRQNAVVNAALNGLRPTNVPRHILRLNAGYQLAPGWQASLHASREGQRAILPDNSLLLPAWTRLDASLRWETILQGKATTWQLGIDNLLNKQFFKESPYQFGHVYLFPTAPRTLRLSMTLAL